MTMKSISAAGDTLMSVIGHAASSDPGPIVQWEVSLAGQMLALYDNEIEAHRAIVAAQSTETLYEMVNDRVKFLRNSEKFTAAMVTQQVQMLHHARHKELRKRALRGLEKHVQFFCRGLYWETFVSDGECEDNFFCATEPYGKWVEASELLEDCNGLFEAVYDAAVAA
jgi:hypothetical protein